MINLDDYEEISEEEAREIPHLYALFIDENDNKRYYKKKSKDDVFKDNEYRFEVSKDGCDITMFGKGDEKNFKIELCSKKSLPLLEQAIEEAKRRRNNEK